DVDAAANDVLEDIRAEDGEAEWNGDLAQPVDQMAPAPVGDADEREEIGRAPLAAIAKAVKDAEEDCDGRLDEEPQGAGAANHLGDVLSHIRQVTSRATMGYTTLADPRAGFDSLRLTTFRDYQSRSCMLHSDACSLASSHSWFSLPQLLRQPARSRRGPSKARSSRAVSPSPVRSWLSSRRRPTMSRGPRGPTPRAISASH